MYGSQNNVCPVELVVWSQYSVCPGGACCMGVSIACVPVELVVWELV